ncbi:MAG: succinate dehydrogenase cytochrome b subunit [Bacteroidia bacterium]
MSTLASTFKRSIGQKLIMGITGLFLVSFLIVHLLGNLQLFNSDGGLAFNEYTKFMTTNPLIKIAEWILFGGFIVHIIYAAVLTNKNSKARPQKYAYKQPSAGASWFSRNMGISGSIVFIFLAVHLYMFWGIYHFGGGQEVSVADAYNQVWKVTDSKPLSDVITADYIDAETFNALSESQKATKVKGMSMYAITLDSFKQWWIVLLYVVAMILLGMHLNHGFQSAFRTLGLVHDKYMPIIGKLGTGIAILFPAIFAAMPIYLFLK